MGGAYGYVSSTASDALDVLAGVNVAGDASAQSVDAADAEGGESSKNGDASAVGGHVSFDAQMKNTEATIADLLNPELPYTAEDVAESATDVLQPGGGGAGGEAEPSAGDGGGVEEGNR